VDKKHLIFLFDNALAGTLEINFAFEALDLFRGGTENLCLAARSQTGNSCIADALNDDCSFIFGPTPDCRNGVET